MAKNNQIIQNLVSVSLLSGGILICIFTTYFIVTGFDEIWNGQTLWLLGVGIAGLLLSIGITAILIATNKKRRAPNFLMISTVMSFILILLGLIQI